MKLVSTCCTILILIVLSLNLATAQNVRQWVARQNGPLKNGNDAGTAITTDDSGNVYVAGWVTTLGINADFATMKYSPDGSLIWKDYFDGGGDDRVKAIAVDSGGNVYVTGSSSGPNGLDYLTMKYRRDGTRVTGLSWPARYNGPGNGEDVPVAITVNDSLVVFVTGWSKGASTGFDYATLRYDSSGAQKWLNRFEGVGDDKSSGMAVRNSGASAKDIYVTGYTTGSSIDYLTQKIDGASGATVWTVTYDGPGAATDKARAIIIDGATEIYVTGGSQGAGTKMDFATIRYDAGGVEMWVSRYNGSANDDDEATNVALGTSGRIIVAGKSIQTGSFTDIATIRYSQSNGNEDWVSLFNGSGNDIDVPVALIGGNTPYILGSTTSTGVALDYGLVHLKSNGSLNWSVTYNGVGNSDDKPYAMTTKSGAVYVTGSSIPKGTTSDILTIKYVDQNKMKYRTFTQDSLVGKGVNLKSSSAVPNNANVRDEAFTKAYPKIKKGYPGAPGGLLLGNVYTDSAAYGWIRIDKGKSVGAFLPHTTPAHGFDTYGGAPFVGEKKNPKLDKYNNHLVGELLALRMNIGASDAEVTPPTLGDVTYDDNDTANHYNGMTLRELASLTDNLLTYWWRYPSIDWVHLDTTLARINRAFKAPLGKAVSVVPLVVTGVRPVDSVSYLQPAINPMPNPISIPDEWIEEAPQTYSLSQNYPNPFNPMTTIEFDLPASSIVTMKVYDMLGREVALLADNEPMDEGKQEVSFDASNLASGVYFYRLVVNNGEYQKVKKMILIR